MALERYQSELNQFVQKMFEEGLVNSQFLNLQTLKEIKKDFVLKEVVAYYQAVKNLFIAMSVLMEENVVNFPLVQVHAIDLFERSQNIGAETVRIASGYLVEGCQAFDKDYCARALYITKHEYAKLLRKMEVLLKMERKIIDYERGFDQTVRRTDQSTSSSDLKVDQM